MILMKRAMPPTPATTRVLVTYRLRTEAIAPSGLPQRIIATKGMHDLHLGTYNNEVEEDCCGDRI